MYPSRDARFNVAVNWCVSGEITIQDSNLDRETQSQYKLIVQASDSPGITGGKTSTTIVTINIIDINDNMASFKEGMFTLMILTNFRPSQMCPL